MQVAPSRCRLVSLQRIGIRKTRRQNRINSFWKNNRRSWTAKVSNSVLSEEAMMAVALRAQLGVAPKVDLEDLAAKLRLAIVEVDSQSFDGALLRSSRDLSGRILVRRGIREAGRRQYTIAHEIGHFMLHGNQQIPCSSSVIEGWKEGQPKPEREADS